MRIGLMRDVPAFFSRMATEGDGQMHAVIGEGVRHSRGEEVPALTRRLVSREAVGHVVTSARPAHSEPFAASRSRRMRSATIARSPLPSNSICSTVRRMTRPSARSLRFVLGLVT